MVVVCSGYLAQKRNYPAPHEGLQRPGHINCLWFLSPFSKLNGGTCARTRLRLLGPAAILDCANLELVASLVCTACFLPTRIMMVIYR